MQMRALSKEIGKMLYEIEVDGPANHFCLNPFKWKSDVYTNYDRFQLVVEDSLYFRWNIMLKMMIFYLFFHIFFYKLQVMCQDFFILKFFNEKMYFDLIY